MNENSIKNNAAMSYIMMSKWKKQNSNLLYSSLLQLLLDSIQKVIKPVVRETLKKF